MSVYLLSCKLLPDWRILPLPIQLYNPGKPLPPCFDSVISLVLSLSLRPIIIIVIIATASFVQRPPAFLAASAAREEPTLSAELTHPAERITAGTDERKMSEQPSTGWCGHTEQTGLSTMVNMTTNISRARHRSPDLLSVLQKKNVLCLYTHTRPIPDCSPKWRDLLKVYEKQSKSSVIWIGTDSSLVRGGRYDG